MEKNKTYTMENILAVIRELSYSQGFYGRLLRSIYELKENDEERYMEFCEELENQGFTEPLDVVFYFEQ